jgi:hypothetical protein
VTKNLWVEMTSFFCYYPFFFFFDFGCSHLRVATYFWVSNLILSFYMSVSLFLIYRFFSKAHTSDRNLENWLKKNLWGGGRDPPRKKITLNIFAPIYALRNFSKKYAFNSTLLTVYIFLMKMRQCSFGLGQKIFPYKCAPVSVCPKCHNLILIFLYNMQKFSFF